MNSTQNSGRLPLFPFKLDPDKVYHLTGSKQFLGTLALHASWPVPYPSGLLKFVA